MSLRCHFDSDGWLQGPIRITHVMTPNHFASGFAAKARGMVQHTEDGFEAGTVATFMNPANQVSAFFSVSEAGDAHQYLPVGRGFVAWAEEAGNPEWYSTEYEDKTRTGDPMTQPQLLAGAQILEACSARDGFPLQATDDPHNGRGLILHADGGQAWGGHTQCPGPVRAAQRKRLIELSRSIRAGSPVPAPPAKAATVPSVRAWTTAGVSSLAELAAAHKTEPSTVLRLTAERSPSAVYPGNVAAWLNSVFAGRVAVTSAVPKGLTLYLPG